MKDSEGVLRLFRWVFYLIDFVRSKTVVPGQNIIRDNCINGQIQSYNVFRGVLNKNNL